MKSYLKPQMELNQFNMKENVASLNDWLSSASGSEYAEAGITTYLVQS